MGKRGPQKGTIYKSRTGKLTNAMLLKKLREAYDLLGHPVSSRDMRKLKNFPSSSIYENRFGSWSNVIKLVGLPAVTGEEIARRGNQTKAIKYGHKLQKRFPSMTLRFKIFNRDNFTCQYCGRTPQDGAKLVIDHKNPVANGGKFTSENLITSCFECNAGKSDLILSTYKPRKRATKKEVK